MLHSVGVIELEKHIVEWNKIDQMTGDFICVGNVVCWSRERDWQMDDKWPSGETLHELAIYSHAIVFIDKHASNFDLRILDFEKLKVERKKERRKRGRIGRKRGRIRIL